MANAGQPRCSAAYKAGDLSPQFTGFKNPLITDFNDSLAEVALKVGDAAEPVIFVGKMTLGDSPEIEPVRAISFRPADQIPDRSIGKRNFEVSVARGGGNIVVNIAAVKMATGKCQQREIGRAHV